MDHFSLGDGRAVHFCCRCWYWESCLSQGQFHVAPISVAARSKVWVCGCSLAGNCGFESCRYMDVSCECRVLSGRDFCNGPVRCPEKAYRVWCVWIWWRLRRTTAVEPWEENKLNLAWHRRVSEEQLCSEGHTENIVYQEALLEIHFDCRL
jgi:hypothetical protein